MKIEKNGLHFTPTADGGYTCDELAQIPQRFEERYSANDVDTVIARFQERLKVCAYARSTENEDLSSKSDEDRRLIGGQRLDAVIQQLTEANNSVSLFQKFLFWFSDRWWYYHPTIMRGIEFRERDEVLDWAFDQLHAFLLPCLPDAVRGTVRNMNLCATSIINQHFAMLFVPFDGSYEMTRRIVTDTQLFEIRDVNGYVYLDVTAEGKPVARSACECGMHRVFFDGVRLMKHHQFMTCAPKTILIDGGYKVNSTECTIVNGLLFPLLDHNDNVAHTTGQHPFFGIGFTREEHADGIKVSEASAARMKVLGDVVTLDGNRQQPIGRFVPSNVTLLDSGFAHYEYSEFQEIDTIRYRKVLVVDDQQDWIDKVTAEFIADIPELHMFRTSSADEALAKILEVNPEVVLLDMHYTKKCHFEGIWIANQLAERKFRGKVFLASSSSREDLRAMQEKINMPTVATGKILTAIRMALCGIEIG